MNTDILTPPPATSTAVIPTRREIFEATLQAASLHAQSNYFRESQALVSPDRFTDQTDRQAATEDRAMFGESVKATATEILRAFIALENHAQTRRTEAEKGESAQ